MNGKLLTIEEIGKRLKSIHDYYGVEGNTGNIRDFTKNNVLTTAITKNNVLIKGKGNENLKRNNGRFWKWNIKYRLSIELAQLIYNEYRNTRDRQEKVRKKGYCSINEASILTGIEITKIYRMIRKGKLTAYKISGKTHLAESEIAKIKDFKKPVCIPPPPPPKYIPPIISIKDAPVQDNTWQRQVDAQIMLFKDVLKHNGNDIKNLRDEIVTLRLQVQSLRKSNAGLIRRFWRWLW